MNDNVMHLNVGLLNFVSCTIRNNTKTDNYIYV